MQSPLAGRATAPGPQGFGSHTFGDIGGVIGGSDTRGYDEFLVCDWVSDRVELRGAVSNEFTFFHFSLLQN